MTSYQAVTCFHLPVAGDYKELCQLVDPINTSTTVFSLIPLAGVAYCTYQSLTTRSATLRALQVGRLSSSPPSSLQYLAVSFLIPVFLFLRCFSFSRSCPSLTSYGGQDRFVAGQRNRRSLAADSAAVPARLKKTSQGGSKRANELQRSGRGRKTNDLL